jgi:hypothetical protein
VIDPEMEGKVKITVIATGFDRAVAHMDDPIVHQPIERKRATQIAMPYVAPTRPVTLPPPVQPVRPDPTPVTAPMRSEPVRPAAPAPAAPARMPLATAPLGSEETELDIPAFLRHPPRSGTGLE